MEGGDESATQASHKDQSKHKKSVPLVVPERKVIFRKKGTGEETKQTPEEKKEVKRRGSTVRYVKKGTEEPEEEKIKYVDMKPQEKKVTYKKKGEQEDEKVESLHHRFSRERESPSKKQIESKEDASPKTRAKYVKKNTGMNF